MASLHNRISQKELKARLFAETEPRVTLSFYRYFSLAEPALFRDGLYLALDALAVFGRIYLATEGINAQLSVPVSRLAELGRVLDATPGLENLRLNRAIADTGKSFWVLKIKVRPRIVADGITDATFRMDRKGSYVNAEQFNRLTQHPDTVVVDMRNHYEYEVGHFRGAIEIPSDRFSDQLPMAAEMLKDKKDNPVIMYCTGGIRCEKASAYLLHQGFRNVCHLEGGIIQYAHTVREMGLENKFRGKNFVFDDRMGERVTGEVIASCHQCGQPADDHVNCRNDGCHRLFIQCARCGVEYQGCCSAECQAVYRLPAEAQAALRKGQQPSGNKFFNKSRQRRPGPLPPAMADVQGGFNPNLSERP